MLEAPPSFMKPTLNKTPLRIWNPEQIPDSGKMIVLGNTL